MLNRLKLRPKISVKKIDFVDPKGLSKMLLFVTISLFPMLGCLKEDIDKRVVDLGNYAGTFETAYDFNINQDSVYLNISNGYYECSTNLPYNYGAGILEISETTLNFIDTLFFPIPALYISGFALSGEYKYQYDGENLILEKVTESDNLIYRMKKE
jgi:hypothetical protein